MTYTGALTANVGVTIREGFANDKIIFAISKLRCGTATQYDNGTAYINAMGTLIYMPASSSYASDIAIVVLYKGAD